MTTIAAGLVILGFCIAAALLALIAVAFRGLVILGFCIAAALLALIAVAFRELYQEVNSLRAIVQAEKHRIDSLQEWRDDHINQHEVERFQ